MSEGAEIDERVDLDEENYMEEMDDDVEEQVDDDGVDGDGAEDENAEGSVEEHEYEELAAEADGKDQLAEAEKGDIATEFVEEDGEKPPLIDEDEKQKHDELLALPPHGSEVFIGGLPRDACEDDLRELCEPMGDILEVRVLISYSCDIINLSFSSDGKILVYL